MSASEKAAASNLAVAFLKKGATRTRFLSRVQRSEEDESRWISDFYHPRWRDLRGKQPYGVRVSVAKKTGKAAHFATLGAKEPKQPPEPTR